MTSGPTLATGPAADAAPDAPPARRGRPAVVVTLVVAATGLSTAPTPLFPLYAARDGLAAGATAAVFAVFAGGVLAGLGAAPALVGRLGQRRVLLAAAAVEVVAAAVLALAPGVVGLAVGRVVCGVGVGALVATAPVVVRSLTEGAPARVRQRWASVTGAMAMAGLGLGPLLAGVLAALAPLPLHLPYAVVGAVVLVLLVPLARTPETSAPVLDGADPRGRPTASSGAPAPARLRAFCAFAVTGFFGALAAETFALVGAPGGVAVTGAGIAAVFLAGAAAPLVLGARSTRAGAGAHVALLAGLAAAGAALLAGLPWLLLLSGPVAGAGSGVLIARVLAEATERAGVTGARAVLTAAYCGLALPVLGLGALLLVVPLDVAVVPFTLLVAVLLLLAGSPAGGRRAAGRGGPGDHPAS
ncbi:MFS transporter [Pseudokineococcus marinus]|uniref:MFS transporter n=1 Tax=Pseudokineococcus marinus TaxID=351215 RepID=A0A849BL84_9ACTN|nr:MFS transporter [Pseudokineococcus marinus]NNH21562.1 MFS transporter [Pseudokineococcus marinus]